MIKQFKFANGDEVICELISSEPDEEEMICRYAFKLLKMETDPQVSYYSFRPWMTLKDEISEPISINSYHVVAMCQPSIDMLVQYKHAITRFQDEEESEVSSLSDAYEKLQELKGLLADDDWGDSAEFSNILDFPGRNDKIH
jgi:hypothetical protein